MSLPEGVQTVTKPNGRTYYYWAPGRGTKRAGERKALGSDARDPQFWIDLRSAKGVTAQAGTFERLIGDFKASPEWERLRPRTQKDYSSYLDKLATEAGDRLVSALTAQDVYAMRDGMAETPVSANHMLSILRTIVQWGVQRAYRLDNPVIGIKPLQIEAGGAAPWPEEGYSFVLGHAPPDLYRMAFLGRATGQRAGDLVRMKPAHLEPDGINVWIGKRREKKHFVPLTNVQITEIKSWGVSPLDLFIKSTRNKPYSADHLGSRWGRWRDETEAMPIKTLTMTIHGLRATAVADRRRGGSTDGGIADELGMSVAMVHHYSRFADKAATARASRDRREQAVHEFENSAKALKTP